ncbi:hypothetical protein Ahia01_000472600 [Argonauta hians]
MTIVIVSPSRFYYNLNMELSRFDSPPILCSKFSKRIEGPGRLLLHRSDPTLGLSTTSTTIPTVPSEAFLSAHTSPPPG